jgi:hypothetical protein
VGLVVEAGAKYFLTDRLYAEGVVGLDLHTPGTWTLSDGSKAVYTGIDNEPAFAYSNVRIGYLF